MMMKLAPLSASDQLAALRSLVPGATFHSISVEAMRAQDTEDEMRWLARRARVDAPVLYHVAAIRRLLEARGRAKQPSDSRQALDLRTAERRLGIHRSTLAAHLRTGAIKAVSFGSRTRITVSEIERVLREGLPGLAQKSPKIRKHRKARRPGDAAAAIRALKI